MPLDLPALLRETGALLTGHFRLSSGLHSPGYVQCARLLEQPRNAKAIGTALAGKLRDAGARKVVSPALGGVIIGCIQQISDNRIGGEWTPAVVFAYLVLIMVFKPQGLLGEQTREAG